MNAGGRRSLLTTTAGLALSLFLLIVAASAIPLVSELQSRINDTFIRLAPRPSTPSSVVLVLVDDESLRQYGRWPWSRTRLAQLVRNVGSAGAGVIGIDVLLTEPQSTEADQELRKALDQGPHVVLVDKIASYSDGPHWLEPISALLSPKVSIGDVDVPLDRDGVSRRFSPLQLSPDGNQWAFGVEVARSVNAARVSDFLHAYDIEEPTHTGAFTLVAPRLVPIAFRRDGFRTISAAQVLQGESLEDLRGHPVLIGFGPTEISDRFITPISGELPTAGVEINAQIVDGILTSRQLHEVPTWVAMALVLLSCPLLVLLFRRVQTWPSVALVFVIGITVYSLGFLMYVLASYLLPVGGLLSAVVLAPLLTYSADFVIVERSLTTQLRQLQRWLFSLNRRSAPPTTGLSWKLRTLEDLQAELGALYELHQTLLESTQDAVAIFNHEGLLILRNEQFGTLLRLRRDTILSLDAVLAKMPTVLASTADESDGAEEVTIHGRLYALRTTPLPPTTLSPEGGTVLTLTSLETRQERDRARAESLSFLTHELRTPLASIQQFAELMMLYPDSPACAGAPETVYRESKRLLALISSYLDVLRLDAGARPIRMDPVDMRATVLHVFDILRPLAASAEITLKLLPGGELATASGDGPLLTGAVLNLVSNAIKYGVPGSEIHVSCLAADQMLVLTVSNEALSISEQDVPRFFEAHYRSATSEASVPGWGLGLAFVKRIAEKHGGSVRATTAGSRIAFEMHLPEQAVAPVAREIV